MLSIGNVKIVYDQENEINGAFRYIQRITHETDIVSKNYVKVTVSSSNNENPSNPIIDNSDQITYWQSKDIDESWYEVDFLNNLFYLESYIFRMNKIDYFKEWKILGSNDGIHYDVLDNHTNYPMPDIEVLNRRFICQTPLTRRIFRYQTKGERYGGQHLTAFHRFDIFGSFVAPKKSNNYLYTNPSAL